MICVLEYDHVLHCDGTRGIVVVALCDGIYMYEGMCMCVHGVHVGSCIY